MTEEKALREQALRKQLAERCYRACWMGLRGDADDFDAQPPPVRMAWLSVADVCLRQMQWTLRCTAEVTRQIGPEEKSVDPRVWELWAHILETGPLTLAPDDWKP